MKNLSIAAEEDCSRSKADDRAQAGDTRLSRSNATLTCSHGAFSDVNCDDRGRFGVSGADPRRHANGIAPDVHHWVEPALRAGNGACSPSESVCIATRFIGHTIYSARG
jgi:hypothetical protein